MSFVLVVFLTIGIPVLIVYQTETKNRLRERTRKTIEKLTHIVNRRDLPRDDE